MPTQEQREKRKRIREGSDGLPVFVIEDQVKKYCHRCVDFQNEEGEVEAVTMRTTSAFLLELNRRVNELVVDSIESALTDDGRTNLTEGDVPSLNGGDT